MRFSKIYNLNKSQAELDFVDIPLHTDIPLFIDPYALSIRNDLFSMECSNIIINFFQKIIDDIRSGKTLAAQKNLDYLSEPNETHLGYSSKKSIGKGVSGKQSEDLFSKLKQSKAVETGFLKDLSDCELIIPGISKDKISDIVTNLIKQKLIEYTEQQCITYNIPTLKVSSGKFWDHKTISWKESFVNLPVKYDKRIILVPKAIVRYALTYDHKKFYNGFVLAYLQEEHLSSNTGLVTLLKNGSRTVYKKDLKNEDKYRLTKEFLYNFSQEHPEILEKYVTSLPDNQPSLSNDEIEDKQTVKQYTDINQLISKLKAIPTGTNSASEYHDLMIGILEVIFYPNLFSPTKEERIHEGRKRIDITYYNGAKRGFFEYLANHIPCPFIICECKNYTDDPENPEIDQLSGRFSPRRGVFGILLCRKIDNKELIMKRCKDTANDGRGFIIPLDDTDIITILNFKKNKQTYLINNFFENKYKELTM